MDKDKFEFTGKNSSFLWDSEKKILYIGLYGDFDAEAAKEFKAADDKFFKEFFTGDFIKMLVDALKITSLNHEARRILSDAVKNYNVKTKVAVCYKNIVFKIIGSFIAAGSMNKINIMFATNREEALRWLMKK